MEERWKDVVGYEGLYQVSNLGNIRSLNWQNTNIVKEMYLKKHRKGYKQIQLVKNGIKKMYLVHRLVAQSFIPNPNNYPIVNHIDENKANNIVENLEWCTNSYNVKAYTKNHPYTNTTMRKLRKGCRYGIIGDKNIVQYTKDGNIVDIWENARTIEIKTKMSAWAISECCRNNRKSAYGYIWQYAN